MLRGPSQCCRWAQKFWIGGSEPQNGWNKEITENYGVLSRARLPELACDWLHAVRLYRVQRVGRPKVTASGWVASHGCIQAWRASQGVTVTLRSMPLLLQ